MATGGSNIAKAGWLYRQSSVLHRWKKNWFVLYCDGNLLFFDTPNCHRAEDRIVVFAQVKQIYSDSAPVLVNVSIPEGASRSCLFGLGMKEGTDLILCAESTDDSKAWQVALEEARVLTPPAIPQSVYSQASMMMPTYPPLYTYPGQVLSSSAPGTYYVTPSSMTTTVYPPPGQVVYVDDDYFGPYRRRYGTTYYGGVGGPYYIGGPLWW